MARCRHVSTHILSIHTHILLKGLQHSTWFSSGCGVHIVDHPKHGAQRHSSVCFLSNDKWSQLLTAVYNIVELGKSSFFLPRVKFVLKMVWHGKQF